MLDELVERLSKGRHKVVIGERNESYKEIEERIKDGFFHIKFIETRGGTELGINVDQSKTNINEIDLETGLLHIEGKTNLNYTDVRLVADIDMKSKSGEGFLQIESK